MNRFQKDPPHGVPIFWNIFQLQEAIQANKTIYVEAPAPAGGHRFKHLLLALWLGLWNQLSWAPRRHTLSQAHSVPIVPFSSNAVTRTRLRLSPIRVSEYHSEFISTFPILVHTSAYG
jgi:hypothetical protein